MFSVRRRSSDISLTRILGKNRFFFFLNLYEEKDNWVCLPAIRKKPVRDWRNRRGYWWKDLTEERNKRKLRDRGVYIEQKLRHQTSELKGEWWRCMWLYAWKPNFEKHSPSWARFSWCNRKPVYKLTKDEYRIDTMS